MKLYFAPLEGITKFIYRNVHEKMFGGCDAYFAPFITPSDNEKIGLKAIRDIIPENNPDIKLKIQVQTGSAASFMKFEKKIEPLKYGEVNINLGCPSGTVVNKGRGAGMLKDPDALENFLDGVFQNSKLNISIKTRSGYFSGEEMETLIRLYNKFPVTQVILHPRCRNEFYNGTPDYTAFETAYALSKNPLCYNGDICSVADCQRIAKKFPDICGVMIGRGAVANPAIFREIKGGVKLTTDELQKFTVQLGEAYMSELQSETFTLHKLKEVWMYMMWNYPEEKKILKQIKKANKLSDLQNAISCLPEIISEK